MMKRTTNARNKARVAKFFFLWTLTFALCPATLAQEAAGQGWATAESRQRSSSAISLAVTGSRYDVTRSTSEIFSPAVGRRETAEESLPPFPVLMPKAIVYPRKAIRKGWEGQTVVAAEVLPDGSVGRTALARSSGHEILDNAAKEAIRSWKFEHAFKNNGETPPQYVDIPVTFKLQSGDRS